MIEPYRTMFEGFGDHWLLAPYLTGDEPDWGGLAAEDRLEALSNGEKVLLDFAAAYRNVTLYLDRDLQWRVSLGLRRHWVQAGVA